MANTLATTTLVFNRVGERYVNELVIAPQMDMQYSDLYADPSGPGGKVGDTVKVRLPFRVQVTTGSAYQPQNIIDQTVNVSLTNYYGTHLSWGSQQGTLELQFVDENYIAPCTDALANAADVFAGNAIYRDIWNTTGTLGTTPSTPTPFSDLRVKLAYGGTSSSSMAEILDLMADSRLSLSTATYFTPQSKFNENWTKNQFASGQLGIEKWFRSPNIPKHTSGSATGASTPIVNGASQTGSSLVTSGWSSFSGKRGDIIRIAGVRSVNPQSYLDTGQLQDFTLTADVTDSAGAATLSISPSIITSGPLQTVTGSPANSAVITYWSMAAGGTQAATVSPQSLLLGKGAAAFVMADLMKPNAGAASRFIRSKQWNISLRYIEQYQAASDTNMNRVDLLCGAALLNGLKAGRTAG